MWFSCPTCRRDIDNLRGRSHLVVYCPGCGRGSRFKGGFWQGYLYAFLNHPILSYLLLMMFTIPNIRRMDQGRGFLFWIFSTAAFLWARSRIQKSAGFVEPYGAIPMDEAAGGVPPRVVPPAPPAPVTFTAGAAPPVPSRPRVSFLAVLSVLLSSALALWGLVLSLPVSPEIPRTMADLLMEDLDGFHLAETIRNLTISDLKVAVTAIPFVTGLALAGGFVLLLVARTVVKARGKAGGNLLGWSVFLLVLAGVLTASGTVTGLANVRRWSALSRTAAYDPDRAMEAMTRRVLSEEARFDERLVSLKATRELKPAEALIVLEQGIRVDDWLLSSVAMLESSRRIRLVARQGPEAWAAIQNHVNDIFRSMLSTALRGGSRALRTATIESLGEIGPPRSTETLLLAIEEGVDRHGTVTGRALRPAGDAAVAGLERLLASTDQDVQYRARAALLELRCPAVVPHLMQLTAQDEDYRGYVAQALSEMPADRELVQALVHAIEHDPPKGLLSHLVSNVERCARALRSQFKLPDRRKFRSTDERASFWLEGWKDQQKDCGPEKDESLLEKKKRS
jgi:hypothetical protein